MDHFLHEFNSTVNAAVGTLWGVHTYFALLALGVLFTVWSRFIQYRALTHGVQLVRGKYDDRRDPGAINHFQALSTALSGTVGLGNIAGVAIAISVGGPGALFWMWMTGLFGMAIKATEVTLTMMYRDTSDADNPHGGAMWVITRGWGEPRGGNARWIARLIGSLFATALLLATFTGGNMFQAWNVADITYNYFGIPQVASGIIMAAVTAMVIIGGIKRIGDVTGWLTPLMCGIYLLAGIVVLIVEAANIPALLALIVREAFAPTTAQGAFLGASAWFGLTTGLRRALFSNEAGQGSSPVAHAAAKTREPAREGIVAGLEPFVDTCVVCTLTALVILSTGTWNRGPIGTLRQPIELVTINDGGRDVTRVSGTHDVSILPELGGDERWTEGYSLFLLAKLAAADADSGSELVRVIGDVRIVDTVKRTTQIVWREVNGNATLVDDRVYRHFEGAALTGHAFDRAIPGLGKWLVTLTCWLFAISTLISWSYYGEQSTTFLFGSWAVPYYKLVFCLACVAASVRSVIPNDTQIGAMADLGAGCMLFTNAPIILLLAHRAMAELRLYRSRLDRGEFHPHAAPKLADVMDGRDVE